MQRVIEEEIVHICAVCYMGINMDSPEARNVDGFWTCSSDCSSKLLKEKKMWTDREWNELGKMQELFEERQRAEIKAARKAFGKIIP